jgi:molybdenum cofactor biosynthesis protein B
MSRAHVVTISDRASAKKMEDESGPALARILAEAQFEVSGPQVVPDDLRRIADAIVDAVDLGADIVVTTGGTGLGPRDVTPQATSEVIDFEVPGIAETMRLAGAAKTPMAALSRGLAGVRGRALIINVPGSVEGATESLDAVLPMLGHAVRLLHGDTSHDGHSPRILGRGPATMRRSLRTWTARASRVVRTPARCRSRSRPQCGVLHWGSRWARIPAMTTAKTSGAPRCPCPSQILRR